MVKAITTTISDEYHKLAKENNIGWHNALARGIKVLLDGDRTAADIEELRAGNIRLQKKLSEFFTEIEILKQQNKNAR